MCFRAKNIISFWKVSVTLSVTAVRIMAWVIRESEYIRRSAFVRFFTEIPNTSS